MTPPNGLFSCRKIYLSPYRLKPTELLASGHCPVLFNIIFKMLLQTVNPIDGRHVRMNFMPFKKRTYVVISMGSCERSKREPCI